MRERWPKERRSSGANQRALRRSSGFFVFGKELLDMAINLFAVAERVWASPGMHHRSGATINRLLGVKWRQRLRYGVYDGRRFGAAMQQSHVSSSIVQANETGPIFASPKANNGIEALKHQCINPKTVF